MSEASYTEQDLVRLTVATWLYELHREGVAARDARISAALSAVDEATDAKTGDQAGWALVNAVGEQLTGLDGPSVQELAERLFPEGARTDMGDGDRAERTSRIRKYQFSRRLPWLARIIERKPDGEVGPTWLLVQGCTDWVLAMDPNPWNDIDEERELPVSDFMVLWELDGCPSVHVA